MRSYIRRSIDWYCGLKVEETVEISFVALMSAIFVWGLGSLICMAVVIFNQWWSA